MSKDMTPMKRFSTNMQELRRQLKPFFNEVSLNKSEPKSYYARGEYKDSAGVENDFILIFSDKSRNLSFALSFYYIGLEIADQMVQASVKNGKSNNDIMNSESMTLDEFKGKLNSFNKWLADITASQPILGIVEKFSETFLDKRLDIKKEVEKKEKEMADFITEKSKDLNIPNLKDKSVKANNAYDNANTLIKNEIEASLEYKELQLIEKRAKELRNIIDNKKDNLEKKMGKNKLYDKKQDAEFNLRSANYTLEMEVNNKLKKTTRIIAKQIKPKY